MTVEERLASIDAILGFLDQRLEEHTEADNHNFERLSSQLESIEFKVDTLRLSEAERKGAADNNNKRASVFGGGVAAALVAVVEGIRYFVR